MNDNITPLFNDDILLPIDRHFADFILEISSTKEADIHLAAALVSWSTRNGNVCLDLNTAASDPQFKNAKMDKPIIFPDTGPWIDRLSACNVIGKPGDYSPLILDSQNRLYFYRYWEYEKNIADTIKVRLGKSGENINYQKLKEGLNRLFDSEKTGEMDMQRIAAIIAVLSKFCVISGGPGTGKTTTVAKILALLIEQAGNNQLNIILCAPTGKAASSLSETIRSAKTNLRCNRTLKDAIPDEAFTIHRLLKNIPRSPYFRHTRDNPLQADTVVVDEASMVDAALMAKLFNAVPDDARIILVGDKDQLSSVEAGSALGDICNRETVYGISEDAAGEINEFLNSGKMQNPAKNEQKKGIRDHIIVLDKNYRFDTHSGIGGLSSAVNHSDTSGALRLLSNSEDKGIELLEIADPKTLYRSLKEKTVEKYSQYLAADGPNQAVNLLNQFKILCPLRSGPFGVDNINKLTQNILKENGMIDFDERNFDPDYKGRPILITQNDYSLGLFNGDTGIIMPALDKKDGELQAFFPLKKDEIRQVPLHRLPEHETVYAMTIHKSQGSEFKDVLIILPDKYYPILTRELIYTGITRAMNRVSIWGRKEVLKEAIERTIVRTSGLRDALWDT